MNNTMEKNITPDDGDMEQKLKNGKFLIVFQDEISKMIQKVKSTGTSEKIDILDIVPEELTEVDARMWQKLKNYPESIILQEELDNYKYLSIRFSRCDITVAKSDKSHRAEINCLQGTEWRMVKTTT